MKLSTKKIAYSFLLILVTTFLYNSYYDYKINNSNYTLSVNSTHAADGKLELYYDVGYGFSESGKIESKIIKGQNKTIFNFNNKIFFKKFRLDFGDNERVEEITIHSIILQSANKDILFLKQSEVLKNVQFFSPNVEVKNDKIKIVKGDNLFDPYIEFKSINRIIIPSWINILILFLPFLVFNLMSFCKEIYSIILKREIDVFFIILFLISIPLKESLTTFVAILWLCYIIFILIRSKTIEINLTTFVCFSLFLIPVLLGRPSNYNQINILLSFLIFGIISIYPIKRDFIKIQRIYIFIIGIISLAIIASWLNYIIYYANYDDVTLYGYFNNIKWTNENIREWFGFSHPAYMSVFSIIGMFFSFESYKRKIIDKKNFILNILITFVLIVVLGSRIALLLFLIMITLFVLPKINYKKMLFIFFIITSIGILSTINKIDIIRHQLWSLSLSAIKEKPLMGYGLGSSKNLISNKELNHKNGYVSFLNLNHPHNQYINYILEIGLLGFGVLITLLLIIHFKYKEEININYSTLLFIWCILSIIESPFETSKPTFLFCFFLIITSQSAIFKLIIKSPFKILR